MALSEFDLIRQFFTRPERHTLLGVGDDAALFTVSPGKVIAASSDMLVAGRHFLPDTDPYRLGRKALAVNLSDMAAMGAKPRWVLAAIALPQIKESWIQAFAQGFADEASHYHVDWVGGDTTAGPLNISVTILGEVSMHQALRRDGAKVGDDIYVSGSLGDAAMGLQILLKKLTLSSEATEEAIRRLEQPTPRVELGSGLAGVAHAAIDISDGLLADLGHILERSHVGADIAWEKLPMMAEARARGNSSQIQEAVLAGGDDYELCFTAPIEAASQIASLAEDLGVPVTRIGRIVEGQGLTVRDRDGVPMSLARSGFDHFRGQSDQ